RRLADQDHVGADPALVQPVDDARRAVYRIAFLIAGNQQRKRAGGLSEARDGCDISGDRTLHVVGAAPDQYSVADLAAEGIAAPAFAGWDHVEMSRKTEMRTAGAADRDQILSGAVGRFTHHPAVHFEAERL